MITVDDIIYGRLQTDVNCQKEQFVKKIYLMIY